MAWTLTHDNEKVGEWTDEYIIKVAAQITNNTLDMIYEFLPDPIVQKLTTGDK